MHAMTANPSLQSLEGFLEGLVQQMRIDLGGSNRSVSESLLYGEDIRGASIQSGCETVPETVRCDPLIDSCFDDPLVKSALDLASGNALLQLTEKQSFRFNEYLLALFQISIKDRAKFGVDEAIDYLTTLGLNGNSLLQKINIGYVQTDQLRQPDAGMQEQVNDYHVSISLPAFMRPDCLQESSLLILDQEDWRLSVLVFNLNSDGWIVIDLTCVGQPSEKAFDRGSSAIDGRGLFRLTVGLFLYRSGKQEAIDISGCNLPDVVIAIQMIEQQLQISLLGSNRMWRSAIGKLVIQKLSDRVIKYHD